MTENEAENSILFLEMQFGKSYPKQARAMLISNISNCSSEAGKKAVDKMLSEERYLPSPIVFKRSVAEHDSLIRETIASRQRRENQEKQNILTRPQEKEHAKKACQLVRAVLAGIGREKTIEGMMHMSNLHPNCGWATQANHLQKFFDSKSS